MTNSKVERYYEQRLNEIGQKLGKTKRGIAKIGVLRLMFFLALVLSVYFGVSAHTGYFLLALPFVVGFLYLIQLHLRYKDRKSILNNILKINKAEIKSLKHDFSAFDAGNEYLDAAHFYTYDMDIFGTGSLFQAINRTVTYGGKNELAGWFQQESLDEKTIVQRQDAIKELSPLQDEIQYFRALGEKYHEDERNIKQLGEWINNKGYSAGRGHVKYMAYALPLLFFVSCALSVFNSLFLNISLFIYLLQLTIVASNMKGINREHNAISRNLKILKKFAGLSESIESWDFESEILTDIKGKLVNSEYSAKRNITKLSKIVSAFDSRMNLLAALILEGVLLWDIQCILKIEKWKEKNREYFPDWLNSIYKCDALASLATFSYNNPELAFPSITNKPVFHAKDMGHVLIPAENRVNNDFAIDNEGNICIVTGANMAGKSTFLRTVATNFILAMVGAPVCAKGLLFKPMKIFSSLRTTDSLNKSESYFYAELKRLKIMLDILKKGVSMLVFLDEILKGTNSKDKQKGSMEVLKQIIQYRGTGLIATHDLELTELEKYYPENIENKCFEVNFEGDKLRFDFLLRNGITQKMNAMLLMKNMGIISR